MRIGLALAAAALGVALLALPSNVQSADRDCADFSDQQSAQDYFESKGGPANDPDRLDGDNDGKACDTLPCPCAGEGSPRPTPPRSSPTRIGARITSIVDGDTMRARAVRGGRSYTVRLIGIDTPETVRPGTPVECGGPESSRNLRRLGFRGGRGRRVTLTTDPTQDTRDRYGRLLAYVTRRDGVNLGAEQVRAGWATVYVFRDLFQLVNRFRAALDRARRAGRGVWGKCGGDFHRPA